MFRVGRLDLKLCSAGHGANERALPPEAAAEHISRVSQGSKDPKIHLDPAMPTFQDPPSTL